MAKGDLDSMVRSFFLLFPRGDGHFLCLVSIIWYYIVLCVQGADCCIAQFANGATAASRNANAVQSATHGDSGHDPSQYRPKHPNASSKSFATLVVESSESLRLI